MDTFGTKSLRIDVSKSVKLVRSLLVLRSIHPDQVAYQSGISLENLKAWLNGSTTALSPHSYVELFKFLGVSKGGLIDDRVHLWTLDARWSGKFIQEQLWVLEWAGNLLKDCKMIELLGLEDKKKVSFRKKRIYLIRSKNIRVLLHVVGTFIEPPSVTPEMLPGVTWDGDDGLGSVVRAEGHYLESAEQGSLTISEFDDLFSGDFARCSWENLRLMAREYGVTPAMLMSWIATRGRPMLSYSGSVDESGVLPEAHGSEAEAINLDLRDMSNIPDILRYSETEVTDVEEEVKVDAPGVEITPEPEVIKAPAEPIININRPGKKTSHRGHRGAHR